MDIWFNLARILVSFVAIATVIGGAVADLGFAANMHMSNPHWPPHAKFHNGQTIWLGVFLGLLALWLLWFPGGNRLLQFHLGVVIASLYWFSMLGANLLPGTRWIDPEFEKAEATTSTLAPQQRLMFVLLALLLVSELLQRL
ncbi:hypothetical protein EPA93_46450 [Ktedonosporobacter rubrisoli]|uniref:Uncharacterized protein n=1 Tax=Ktedonosporobacter rubrisoli TaxID=2509675 RepID=A0A4P6K4B0_KTERU|nr:DUF6640 family protein [Ktedonosporobacter rubrisoli]QBD83014.1 hypothetical protein EPA93_46450 [Ktedonosporobacter rubrisoli]